MGGFESRSDHGDVAASDPYRRRYYPLRPMSVSDTTPSGRSPTRRRLPNSIFEAGRILRSGELGSRELTESLLARADLIDGRLGTYVTRMDKSALRDAERADKNLATGNDTSALLGIPLAVKDVIAGYGAPTTAQSAVRDPRAVSMEEASVVRALREAGAIILGKTTTMEFAIGAPTLDDTFPLPRNPWDIDYWAGGSSSGTANGVAGGLFLGGIGTDTGGSIRLPASWCGVTGLKPTFGRVSTRGVMPLAPSYDTVGPIARDARDCALLFAAIAGKGLEACSITPTGASDIAGITDSGDLSDVRIGIDNDLFTVDDTDSSPASLCRAAVEVLGEAGAEIQQVSLPYYKELRIATEKGVPAEALSCYGALLQSRWEEFGASTRMAIGSAVLTTAADYIEIQRVRKIGRRALNTLFSTVDVVVTPTCSITATPVDDLAWDAVLEAMHTAYWNAVGYPAISVPVGLTSSGLPAGLQIAGGFLKESTLLRVAHEYQQRTEHHLLSPHTLMPDDPT